MSRDIVLICLDSIRKDVFDDVATRIQAQSDHSFENCRAASSWSAPSHASMISGLLPHEHAVTTHSRAFDSLPEEQTIFSALGEYRTVGISANVYAGPTYGFDQYFDRFFTLRNEVRFPDAHRPEEMDYTMTPRGVYAYIKDCVGSDQPLKSLVNGFTRGLDSATEVVEWAFDEGARPGLKIAREQLQGNTRPTFVFLNLMEGHIPYRPARYLDSGFYDVPRGWSSAEKGVWELIEGEYDERYWTMRNQLYRSTVDYLDQCIADFVRSLDEETTVIVTADHGDNHGTEQDEGLANHKSSLSEGLLHVPLSIVNGPGLERQTGQHLSHLALPDLIVGCRNGQIPDIKSDRAFAELGGMSPGPDPETEQEYYDRAMRCAYDGSEKIVWDSVGNCSRYEIDVGRANWQRYRNEINAPPSWASDRFEMDISGFKSAALESEESPAIDKSIAKRLENLGYM